MDIRNFYYREGEKPLDNLVADGGFCGILRTIGCIGDSLSSGEFEGKKENGEKLYYDAFDYSWGQYLARMAGTKVYNFSRGGMTAKEYMESFASSKNYFDPEKACQAYIIALGVNDVSRTLEGKMEFGGIDDVCPEDPEKCKDTFAGHYGRLILRYKQISPNAKFFLMTLPRGGEEEKISGLYDKHRDFLYELAEMLENTYVLDLREYAPAYDSEFKKTFFLQGHMNAAGYLLTAKMVASYIDYIIRKNPDDFKKIGFVGSPYEETNLK
ncbi:MAG: SGNH/GDSL hydrolase family protein [Clostridia bacterium]|nr:SGNH/GDSL hydrolase family protein [Clostridia bacterium]